MTTVTEPTFQAWPKLARLYREIVITEKIDGTNAAVGITEDGVIWAQSRSKIIKPNTAEDRQADNHGFAAWVYEHGDELREGLGVGVHFGEWWGPGVNKRYRADLYEDQFGHTNKQFWLFNTHRWASEDDAMTPGVDAATRPACVGCVPVLYKGPFEQHWVDRAIEVLKEQGSYSVHGAPAEGVVVYHTAAQIMLKVTCEHDEMSKDEAKKQRRQRPSEGAPA